MVWRPTASCSRAFRRREAGARRTFLEGLRTATATLVLFETGPRLAASLADMATIFGPRQAAVARELTKLHETIVRGDLASLAADPTLASAQGEIAVVVARADESPAALPSAHLDTWLAETLTRLSPARAAALAARELGIARKEAYARALALRQR